MKFINLPSKRVQIFCVHLKLTAMGRYLIHQICRISFLQLYAVLVYSPYLPHQSYATEPCALTFSELQLGAVINAATNEFIELRASSSCDFPLNLTSYTLVLWNGGNNKSLPAHAMRISDFSVPTCTTMSKQFLVLGNPEMRTKIVTNDAMFCSFDDFGPNWLQNQKGHYWIDKGNNKINALALYKDLPKPIHLNAPISEVTAYREYMVDVLFYKHSGSGDVLKRFLLPEYAIGPSDAPFYCLQDRDVNDDDTNSSESRFSFTYCCPDANLTKWPLGYKWSSATPGQANECGPHDYAVFGVDGTVSQSITLPVELLNKCAVDEIKQFFAEQTVPVVTTAVTSVGELNTGATSHQLDKYNFFFLALALCSKAF